MIKAPKTITMDEIIASSFFDFHVKGFDYICLKRTPSKTLKIYFFDGDVNALPEVVAPHDHRYQFTTTVLCGDVGNTVYVPYTAENAYRGFHVFERFDYLTPLNGGNGFTWRATEPLTRLRTDYYGPGEMYGMEAAQIHTIRIWGPQTVLMLLQREDDVPVGVPTSTWCRDREPPSLDGLYRKPTPDEVRKRLGQLASWGHGALVPTVFE